MLAAVACTKDSAFLLRSSGASEYTGKYDVWIRRMHDDAADSAGLRQSHVGPGSPSVRRLINSVAHHVAIADHPGLPSSRPNDTRIGRCNGQRTDGRGGLLVKNRRPTIASVGRFPNPA